MDGLSGVTGTPLPDVLKKLKSSKLSKYEQMYANAIEHSMKELQRKELKGNSYAKGFCKVNKIMILFKLT